jgi:hypothetical protein
MGSPPNSFLNSSACSFCAKRKTWYHSFPRRPNVQTLKARARAPGKTPGACRNWRRRTSHQRARPNTGNFPQQSALDAFGDATFANLPVALRAKIIDLCKHPGQKLLCGFRRNAQPLQGVTRPSRRSTEHRCAFRSRGPAWCVTVRVDKARNEHQSFAYELAAFRDVFIW